MTVEKILKIFEEGYKGNDKKFDTYEQETKLFTTDSNAFVCESVEQPCISLIEMLIPKNWIRNYPDTEEVGEHEKIKIVVMVKGYEKTDYHHCITVGEFLNFLRHIQNKEEYVAVADYLDLADGNIYIIKDFIDAKKAYCKNLRLRELLGDNALQIWY